MILERGQIRAYFSGDVQGVGFRFTAVSVAREFRYVAGYVRNLPDGRVELVAEGDGADLEALIARLRAVMGGYIQGVEVKKGLAEGRFRGFRIVY